MISASGLIKRYGAAEAVKGISFEIAKGEVVGFLGPNGAGKTTTLRMLSGALPPTSGEIRIGGDRVDPADPGIRRRIGYLPENNPLYPDMDPAEYLEWCAGVRGFRGPEMTRRIRSAVSSCGLGPALGRPIGLLSKGYRQRVGLAAAIMHDPDVLLLDEPTSGLDPNQSLEVRDLIKRLGESKTVLLSTHILPEVEASCDRVLIIHRGELAASGSPGELSASGAGGTALRVLLKAGNPAEAEALELFGVLEGVERAEVSRGGEGLALRLICRPEADPRESVFRLAVERGWTLLGLQKEEGSLEKVFRELTLK